jgi:hypothetical protein
MIMDRNDQLRAAAQPTVPARQSLVRAAPAAPVAADERDENGERKKKKKKDRKAKAGAGRGIETMFRTSYRTHIDMSGLADAKANIMISINGIIVSILLASIAPKLDANPWLLLPTTVLLVSCLASLIYAVLAARPRVSSRIITLDQVRQNAANILFFGNFVSLSEDDYIKGMHELLQDSDRLYTSMTRDIYSLGSVLQRKFRLLRTAYTIFMFGLLVGVSLFILVFAWIVITAPTTTTVGTTPL